MENVENNTRFHLVTGVLTGTGSLVLLSFDQVGFGPRPHPNIGWSPVGPGPGCSVSLGTLGIMGT